VERFDRVAQALVFWEPLLKEAFLAKQEGGVIRC
jgi:hypothetical protein